MCDIGCWSVYDTARAITVALSTCTRRYVDACRRAAKAMYIGPNVLVNKYKAAAATAAGEDASSKKRKKAATSDAAHLLR